MPPPPQREDWDQEGHRKAQAPHSLALRAIAIHAVFDGLMAGLAQRPAGHLHGQSRLCAPLNGTLQPPAVCY